MKIKKVLLGLLVSISLLSFVGCTQQSIAKNFGGEYTLELPEGKKLMEVTWKEDELWYLVRDMKEDENAETYEFVENSSYGVIEGKVIIKESK